MKKSKLILSMTAVSIIVIIVTFQNCKNNMKDMPNQQPVETTYLPNQNSGCQKHLMRNKQNNLNISILLDLSDRISPEKYPNPRMEYKDRDLGYIKSVASVFSNHILNKKSILMHDKLQVFLEPAPANSNINSIISKLKLHFNRNNATRKAIDTVIPTYESYMKDIYNLTIQDNKYVGSDIWSFFKEKVSIYCVEYCYRNILIILTDGYIYHKNTKLREGNKTSYITPQSLRTQGLFRSDFKDVMQQKEFSFIPANQNLNNLEVLVLGIENHDKNRNPYGKDVIKEYWKNWLTKMQVKSIEIHDTDLPVNMEEIIQKFIGNGI